MEGKQDTISNFDDGFLFESVIVEQDTSAEPVRDPEQDKRKLSDRETKSSEKKPQTAACQSQAKSTADSWDSFGSLEELRQELIQSVYKNLKFDSAKAESDVASDYTDNTEVHDVFRDSGLKVRGIDVDNLLTKDGRHFNIYHLYKARFQLWDSGRDRIENEEVVKFVHQAIDPSKPGDDAMHFLFCGTDYRKNAFNPSADPNAKKFKELWENTSGRQRHKPNPDSK